MRSRSAAQKIGTLKKFKRGRSQIYFKKFKSSNSVMKLQRVEKKDREFLKVSRKKKKNKTQEGMTVTMKMHQLPKTLER